MGQLPSENGSCRSLMTDEIIHETFPSTIPESLNNQLGMDNYEYDDSMSELGESTEEEMVNFVIQRQNLKRRRERVGSPAYTKKRPKIIEYDDDSSESVQAMNKEPSSSESKSESSETEDVGVTPTTNVKKKTWHVIIHNKSDAEIIQLLESVKDKFQRIVACRDVAPETGGIHHHIGLVASNSMTFNQIKAIFGDQAHYKWCPNMTNLFRYIQGLGAHSDDKQVIFRKNDVLTKKIATGVRQRFYKELYKKGVSLSNFSELVKEEEFNGCIDQFKHVRNLIQLQEMHNHRRTKKRVVMWICGASGTGKSRLAHEVLQRWAPRYGSLAGVATTSTTSGQITGLMGGEKCVLIDDIKLDKIQLQDLLTITDQYPVTLDIKGGYVKYDPDLVLITCLNSASDLANINEKWSQKEVTQVIRRITHTIKTTKNLQTNNIEYEMYSELNNPLGAGPLETTIQAIFQAVESAVVLN